MAETHVPRKKAVYIRIFLLALAGLGFSTVFYLTKVVESALVWMIISSVAMLLFAVMLFFSTKNLLKKTPALSITSKGIVDNISLAQANEIPWKEIKSVKYETYLKDKQILIGVHHPEKILEGLPYMKHQMVKQQLTDTGAVIVINPKLIKGNAAELAKKIKQRARV